MNKKIFILTIAIILLSIMVLAEDTANKIYVLNLGYNKTDVNFYDVKVKSGYAPDKRMERESGYSAEVISSAKEALHSFKFESPTLECSDMRDPETGEISGGCIHLDETNFTILAPYFKKGEIIDIYDPDGRHVLRVDISHLADFCGNNKCEPGKKENYLVCPEDCPSGYADGYCDKEKDGLCDPDCTDEEDEDCKKKLIDKSSLTLIGVVAIILILILLVAHFKKRESYKRY